MSERGREEGREGGKKGGKEKEGKGERWMEEEKEGRGRVRKLMY